MSYVPSSTLLHGVPYPAAECYGKPHFLCAYRADEFGSGKDEAVKAVNATRLFEGARCMCCGRPATNAHHWPPKRTAPTFTLHYRRLRPALFALCGSGTTGCHNGWHGEARYRALWLWDSDGYAAEWWEGRMLEELGAHTQDLYAYGCWELYDTFEGRIWRVRL